MTRHGMIIGIKSENVKMYKELHASVWPDVLRMIKECKIRNYSIYLREEGPDGHLLFSYFEYTGQDYEADMARMAADPATRRWWDLCGPCQRPLEPRAEGTWWAPMEEVFHLD